MMVEQCIVQAICTMYNPILTFNLNTWLPKKILTMNVVI